MYFTERRLHDYERLMQEKPRREYESMEILEDQYSGNCPHPGVHSETGTSSSDESSGRTHNCNRFFNAKNKEAR